MPKRTVVHSLAEAVPVAAARPMRPKVRSIFLRMSSPPVCADNGPATIRLRQFGKTRKTSVALTGGVAYGRAQIGANVRPVHGLGRIPVQGPAGGRGPRTLPTI